MGEEVEDIVESSEALPGWVLLQEWLRSLDTGTRTCGIAWVSHGGRLLRVVPEHLRPATQAEQTIHELSNQELDNIRKVLSGINVGESTGLVGQPPPAGFDLESYEDHPPGRNGTREPGAAEPGPGAGEEAKESEGTPVQPPGEDLVLFPVTRMRWPFAGPQPSSSSHVRTRSRSPATTPTASLQRQPDLEPKTGTDADKVRDEPATTRPASGSATDRALVVITEKGDAEAARRGSEEVPIDPSGTRRQRRIH